jgi:broad specificity phosphatase PhoE
MQVVLIRHARTASASRRAAMVKGLSEDRRRAARALADDAILRNFTLFASGTEPKAIQTAAAVANGRPISDVANAWRAGSGLRRGTLSGCHKMARADNDGAPGRTC